MPAVGQDIPHDSAAGHVTGGSKFLDDLPPLHGELVVGFFGSPVARGRIKSIDLTAAQNLPGVAALLTHADIPGHNVFGPILQDEYLLVVEESAFIGQPIVVIAAESRHALERARRAISVEMEELDPLFTIDDAIAAKSFIGPVRTIERGDVNQALADAEHILEGEFHVGGQEHFYLENQVAIAVPGEDRTLTVHSSTQHPSEIQAMVSELLHLPFNRVIAQCRRMGGAFGGKETQAAQPAMMAALAAWKTNRPCRFVYRKEDDMRFTGKRHPFKSEYRAGFGPDGRITVLDVKLHSNGGCSADLSLAVMERALLHTDNAYFIPHFRAAGQVCKTNLPSNTAFRGFGGPQGVACTEHVIEEIARHLGADALEIRRRNLYGIESRNVTPYGQRVDNNTLPRLFETILQTSDYEARREEIESFNATNRCYLRGLAVTPVKFGISFTRATLNQANALVNIYTDGTVQVSTGATEMGQGVNTRIRQVVADELGVNYADVLLTITSTEKNNNTSPTAASSGTDLNGSAAAVACRKIRGRLAKLAAELLSEKDGGLSASHVHIRFVDDVVYDDRRPERSMPFRKLILEAYERRLSLGERGFYATPGVDFNRETGKGHPFLYFTNGVAASEVLIDRFTGQTSLVRADVLMDLGKMINPGLDRGQITGAFIQGVGWALAEELVYSDRGHLVSQSPTTYKIPNVSDVPEIFNVATLDNPENVVSLKRGKAVGEPPLLLGISAFCAVKDALRSVSEAASTGLRLPATNEQILMRMSIAEPPAPLAASQRNRPEPAAV